MYLKNKTAIIYGAGGSLGGAVGSAFAAAGARVFCTGHHLEPLTQTVARIRNAGGLAEALQLDALDETAVNTAIQSIAQTAGAIDISFNAIGLEAVQDMPLVDMSTADFLRPLDIAMRSHFITATAAGRQMISQRSGVILSLTATPSGIGYPYVGGFGPACAAIENFSRGLAAELGVYGIRVVNIRSAGSPDSKVFNDAIQQEPSGKPAFLIDMENDTMLKQMPLMKDIANTAVFLVSELAGKITGVTVDVTSGTTAALNYRVPRLSE